MPTYEEILCLNRDTVASMVPSGARIVLQQGTEVRIVSSKGDGFTVMVFGNMARIDGKDADAINKVAIDPLAGLDHDASLEDKAWMLIRSVYDPEIAVNIVELGLVYDLSLQKNSSGSIDAMVQMTLTAPGCGMGPVIANEVETKLMRLAEIASAKVDLVFDPPWSYERMSEAAKLELGVF
jgi:probable FeS assembly SUF system protein SufT